MSAHRNSLMETGPERKTSKVVLRAVAISALLLVLGVVVALAAPIILVDDQGADDYPGQKDFPPCNF